MLNLCETLDLHAKSRPRHPALISADETLDYAGLAERVQQYAAALAADGVCRGDLVGIALKDSADHVVLLFAVMRLGAVIVPLDWRWTDAEKHSLVRHFSVGVVLADDAATISALATAMASAIPQTTTCLIDATWRSNAAAKAPAEPLAVVRRAELPMILSLSSGTTGRPTGPLASHAQFIARMQNQLATLTFNQHDRYLLATPLYFGGGRAFVLTHIVIGATVVLKPPPYSPQQLVAAVAEHGVNSLFLVPTIIRRLLALDDDALAGLSGLRLLISSGAPLHAFERQQIAQRLTQGFFEYYASTEGGGVSVLSPADQRERSGSVGRAAYMVDLEVVDDAHQPVAANSAGRVRYRGPGVADSFFADPKASAVSFHDGWFYPGDIGRLDEQGYLYLLGRSKDVIIRGGVNIYPLEIERTLGGLPQVADAAALGLPCEEFGEQVVAAVVARGAVSLDALYQRCREQLASYKVPSKIVMLDALPKNSAGKTLKAELATIIAKR